MDGPFPSNPDSEPSRTAPVSADRQLHIDEFDATLGAIELAEQLIIAHIDKRMDPLEEAFIAHFGTR